MSETNRVKTSRPCQTVIALLVFSVLAVQLSAKIFDGERKGLVIGGGIGLSPVTKWSDELGHFTLSERGTAINFLIGYAWDGHNALTYVVNADAYSSDRLGGQLAVSGLDGVRYYRYLGGGKSRLFISIAAGRFTLATPYSELDGTGFGYSAGLGWEFARHYGVEVLYLGGHTSNDYGRRILHNSFSVSLAVSAY